LFFDMKVVKGNAKLAAEGRRLEQAGQLADAAATYQRIIDTDPGNKAVVNRLLMIYRRLKEYRKELAVIDTALGAVAQRDMAIQDKWLSAHPEAAKVGKEFLRSLGGQSVTAYGIDPLVGKWMKRKAVVEKKIGGKTRNNQERKSSAAGGDRHQQSKKKSQVAHSESEKTRAAVARKKESEKRKAAAAARKAEVALRKEEKRAAAERKAAEEKAAAKAAAYPSLFVVSLRYLVALKQIDAVMAKHVVFLNKHYAAGTFLVSGRQIPRTGGIILARGKDRAVVERIMSQDPFVKGKLASVDIVEFKASQMGKGLAGWLKGNRQCG
jgi:uncharacterized protein YciI